MFKSTAMMMTAILASLAACGGGNETAATDSATGAAATTTDTAGGMAGMNHDMNRPPAKDADHEFLRMMSDHHEGMIQMATAAMTKGSNATVQGDAHKLHTKQQNEQKRMVAMVQASYGETVMPMIMSSDKTMLDELQGKTGADYDRTFYHHVVAHHREGVKMMDDYASKVTKPEVKQMIERMKADQQREITEFERKAGS